MITARDAGLRAGVSVSVEVETSRRTPLRASRSPSDETTLSLTPAFGGEEGGEEEGRIEPQIALRGGFRFRLGYYRTFFVVVYYCFFPDLFRGVGGGKLRSFLGWI